MSPRSETVNRRMREKSRARILRTALKLFAKHGYEGTSVAKIAERAGISQGLLYNYFRGKEDVLEAIFEQSMADVQESFLLAEAGGPPSQRIEQLVHGAFAIVRRNQDFWRLSYAVRMQPGVVARVGKRAVQWTAMIHETLTRFLAESGVEEPELEAAVLFAVIDGVAQHFVLDPDRYPLDEVAEQVVRRFSP